MCNISINWMSSIGTWLYQPLKSPRRPHTPPSCAGYELSILYILEKIDSGNTMLVCTAYIMMSVFFLHNVHLIQQLFTRNFMPQSFNDDMNLLLNVTLIPLWQRFPPNTHCRHPIACPGVQKVWSVVWPSSQLLLYIQYPIIIDHAIMTHNNM